MRQAVVRWLAAVLAKGTSPEVLAPEFEGPLARLRPESWAQASTFAPWEVRGLPRVQA